MKPWTIRLAAPLLCLLAVIAAYSNCTANEFALDDWHTIQQNPAIRSLDAAHIKRFFTDVNAFSVLPRNIDYRPALILTYAANYSLSQRLHGDGYDTRTWHWFNIALHALASASLFFVGRALIGPRGLCPIPAIDPRAADTICLIAALLFAIHPITSGCVNYISARSSLMVAAMLLPALAIYLNVLAGTLRPWWLTCTAVLYAIALLTKVEAVSFIAVLVLAELLLAPSLRGRPLYKRIPNLPALLRLAAFGAISLAFLILWSRMSTLAANSGKAAAGMTPSIYFLTEVRAWWYYIAEVLAPVHLVFDEAAYPVSGGTATPEQVAAHIPVFSLARALADSRVWFAITAWAIVAAACLRLIRTAPIVPFFVGAFLLYLAPHSSIVPLAEMVNEHRPYLPVSGLFILAAIGGWLLLKSMTPRPGPAFIALTVVAATPLLLMTRERNTIYHDDLSLYGDTVTKSPESARAQMNYGLALMRRARYPEAEARFRRALALAPYWHYIHSNLAICLAAEGNIAAAAAEHDEAVRDAPDDAGPYLWRGRFRAKRGDLAGATADFRAAVERNPSAFTEAACLAACLTRAGAAAEADALTAKYRPLDPVGFDRERDATAKLLSGAESSMSVNNRGVVLMEKAKFPEAEAQFREALHLDPANHLAQSNLGIVRAAQGDNAGAIAAFNRAVEIATTDPSPYYWRARFYAKQSDFDHAIADLTAAADRSNQSTHETAALVECLIRANKPADAESILARARQLGQLDALEKERAAFRAVVFGSR